MSLKQGVMNLLQRKQRKYIDSKESIRGVMNSQYNKPA